MMTENFPERLIDGYRAFRENRLPIEQDRYRELAESGQRPEIMVVGCSDSRVAPEVVFDARPGELFVVRNVANLVPPFSPARSMHGVLAALEFAVLGLGIRHIVVLGHARCGGIRAYATDDGPLSSGDFIGRWMTLIAPAAERLGPPGERPLAEYLADLEQAAILTTLDNLATFPFVSSAVTEGRLHLHAAYFDVANGTLSVGNRTTGVFAAVNGEGWQRGR
jgi:carbonic anhydrase